MSTPLIVVLAALAMVLQDIVATVMVMCEAKGRGWLAGILDAIGWIVGITTLTISVSALQGHDTPKKVAVIVLVTIANVLGTKLGQLVGSRYVHDVSIESRLSALETAAKP